MANGSFGGGTGSPENPYIVEDAQDLNAVRNNLSASYLQSQGIDLSFYANWLPIGAPFSSFTGTYDGGGYLISNVYCAPSIDDSNWVGLFNETFNSLIKNIHLSGTFSGPTHYSVGGIAGAAYFNQSAESSFSVFENCYVQVDIHSSYEDAGGIIGSGWGAIIRYCSSKSTISADYAAGGIAGTLKFGSIENCYSMSSLSGVCAGGIVGYTGGIAAFGKTLPWLYPPTISFSYSASTMSGPTVDGIIGSAYPVSYGASAPLTEQPTTCTDSYFDSTISGIISSDYGEPKTTPEMKSKDTYIDWDFYIDFDTQGIWTINENINSGYPYLIESFRYLFGNGSSSSPYQIWNYEDLYSVRFFQNSYFIQMTDVNLIFTGDWFPIDNRNIDYDGNNKSIKNLTITSINPERSWSYGLFGQLEGIISIYDLKIINATLDCGNEYGHDVGLLAGTVWAYELNMINISNCIAIGKILNYTEDIGGLIGSLSEGNIEDCYTRVEIELNTNCRNFFGGICGYFGNGSAKNCKSDIKILVPELSSSYPYSMGGLFGGVDTAIIENCSSKGRMEGSSGIGGIVGEVGRDTTIRNCYSHCDILSYYGNCGGIVGDAYWYNPTLENCYFNGKIIPLTEDYDYVGGTVGLVRSLFPRDLLIENNKIYITGQYSNEIVETDLDYNILRRIEIPGDDLSSAVAIKNGYIYLQKPLRKIRLSDFSLIATNEEFDNAVNKNIAVDDSFVYVARRITYPAEIVIDKRNSSDLSLIGTYSIKLGSYTIYTLLVSDFFLHLFIRGSGLECKIFAINKFNMTISREETINTGYIDAFPRMTQDDNHIYFAPLYYTKIRKYDKNLLSYFDSSNFPQVPWGVYSDNTYLYTQVRQNGVADFNYYKLNISGLTIHSISSVLQALPAELLYYNNFLYGYNGYYFSKIDASNFENYTKYLGIIKQYPTCYYNQKYLSNVLIGNEETITSNSRSISDLRTQSTYTNWDFNLIWTISSNKNNGLPYLLDSDPFSPFPDGSIIGATADELYLYNIKTSFIKQGAKSYLSRIEKRDLSTLELLDASDFLDILINGPVVVDDNFLYLPTTSYHYVGWGFFHSNTNFIKVEKTSLKVVEKTEDMFSSSAASTDIQDLLVSKDYLITTAVPSNSYNELHSFNKYNLYPHKVRNPSLLQQENNLSLSNNTIYTLNTTNSINLLDISTMQEITSVLLNNTKYKATIKNENIFLTSLGEENAILEKRDKNSPTMDLIESLELVGAEYPSHLLINETTNTEYLNDRKYLFCSGDGELYNKIIKIDSETNTFVTTSEPIDPNPSDIKSICTDGLFLYILNENDNLIKINCKTMEIIETILLEKEAGEVLNKLLYGEKFLYLISEHSAKWKARKIDPETGAFILNPSVPGAGKPFKTVTYNRGNLLGIDSDNILYRIRTSNMLFDSAAPISSANDSILLEAANEYLYSIDTNQEIRSIQEFNWTVNETIPVPFVISETARIYTDKYHLYITPGNNGEIYWLRAQNGLLDMLYKEENLDYNVDILTGDTSFIYLSATNESGTINRLLEYRREDISLNKEINIENSKIQHCIVLNLAIE